MRNILNRLDRMILITDTNGMILFANTAILSFFQASLVELCGQSANVLLCINLEELHALMTPHAVMPGLVPIRTSPSRQCYLEVSQENWEGQPAFMLLLKLPDHSVLDTLYPHIIDHLPLNLWLQESNLPCNYVQTDSFKHYDKLLQASPILLSYSRLYKELHSVIFKDLTATQITLWLYEEDNECIRRMYNSNPSFNHLDLPGSFQINADQLRVPTITCFLNQILPIHQRLDLQKYNLTSQPCIGYMGSYELRLTHTHKFLGVINLIYPPDAPPSAEEEKCIKNACLQLELLIHNNHLTKRINQATVKNTQTEKELEVFLSTAVDLIGIIDSRNGHFIKVNDKWEDLLGWTSQELLNGMALPDLEHPQTGESAASKLAYLNNMESLQGYVTEYCSKSGDHILLECNYKKIEGESLAIFTAKDITQQEVLKLQTKTLEEAIELETLRNRLFASASHELRTPLNIILSTLQLLTTEAKSADHELLSSHALDRYAHTIQHNAYRLLKLINNIIDVARINEGYFVPNLGNHNIINVVETTVESTLYYIQSRNLELIFDTETEEEWIYCDPELIERVILNLISNAIKYSKPNTPGIISVLVSLEEDEVIISVKDTGIGMPPNKLSMIFDRFIQLESTSPIKYESSGIGLSLVKSLVEVHKGTIQVESELGVGSTFKVRLPRTTNPNEDLHYSINHSTDLSMKQVIEFSDLPL